MPAVVPLAAAHALHVLVEAAAFRAGQTVFVNGSGDILGLFLAQLVRTLNGEVFVSVSSQEERYLLMKDYHIPANRIFNQLNPASWTSDIFAAADGEGLGIMINNTMTGSTVRSLSTSVKSGGCSVDVTQKVAPSILDPTVFERGITLSFLNLSALPDSELSTLFDKTLHLAQTDASIRCTLSRWLLSLNCHISDSTSPTRGIMPDPVVIEYPQNATVPLLPSPPPPLYLKPEGTYILAGGLRALGLTTANTLCAHGARHLVFLSRSGASSLRQQETLRSLYEHGCAVDVVRCDVTNAEQFLNHHCVMRRSNLEVMQYRKEKETRHDDM
ncbi:hypothetical protein FE257_008188 [Aspergillus nanangensis]|uniref:Ketoreductase (KR) domain-containing protein n=1 Tax=Aspergillus nanangensis TaxID=2582783 RepID=A0AAD4CLN8_ASPNN|nr:hypothetical protein FE257_008188 [Aspergillus nanangensis]